MTYTDDLLACPVDEEMARSVAEMSDERLVLAYFGNALFAAIAGKESKFWLLQAAMAQEMKRRGLKAKGRLS